MMRDERSSFGPFVQRHVGPSPAEIDEMLRTVGYESLDAFIDAVVPSVIRSTSALTLRDFPQPLTEREALARLKSMADQNLVYRSFIGMGYSDCITPPVIQRNILENPGWYTQYTPYQPEISQGRLEALLNFQTMVSDLTALPVANASLLDEATAAAEAMSLAFAIVNKDGGDRRTFFVAQDCHPQTIAVARTRAQALGIEVRVADPMQTSFEGCFAVLLQYPTTDGAVVDYRSCIEAAHDAGALVVMAADILALALLTPPGELGADIAIGSTQRFGVPLGFGGPHAAYLATRDAYKRLIPGRLVGVSVDSTGRPALRLALQTREQHIRREKATSNICTAQVLLAVMAGMYAVYHGPEGIRAIAQQVHERATSFADGVRSIGAAVVHESFFDTVRVRVDGKADAVIAAARAERMNLRRFDADHVGVSVDETTSCADVEVLLRIFARALEKPEVRAVAASRRALPNNLLRSSPFLTHPVFNTYHSETELLRYMRRLESRDLSLAYSMIPLGSCTMKLNATAEMVPVSWPEFSGLHPFAPSEQTRGYHQLFSELERALADVTGFDAVSLQPNAGSQGEYAGLLAIRGYHDSRGDTERRVCLIPKSAHGTNPASAVMAGFKVVVVECDESGNVALDDLKAKVKQYAAQLGALMVTYPSTHGVFEEQIREICEVVHSAGGQVYMDGANLNALVGLSKPGEFGADVSHINLHKTFCIPHGGGGPGMGPIGVKRHLQPFLPSHPLQSDAAAGPVSAAPWGSASILTISWMYMAMMAGEGLTYATKIAILNANYIARRLAEVYPVVYRGRNGLVAHECILDLRGVKKSSGVEVDDIAKRLMDYGFHAPTVSWPVAGTVMVEPTESESKAELDRFCDAMTAIRAEIARIESGEVPLHQSALRLAPHTAQDVTREVWDRPYSRAEGAFPAPFTREAKFWPAVGRVDSGFGDRNLVCTCPPIDAYQ